MAKRSPQPIVAAIDFGSGSVRCLLTNVKGREVGFAASPLQPVSPPEVAPLGKEFRLDATWKLVARVIKRALRDAGVQGSQVAAVSVTSQREGIAFLDEQGRELYVGPNSDVRAVFQGQAIDEAHGDEVYRITGHLPSLMFTPAKVRWFAEQAESLFDRIRWVLTLDGWIAWRLTGEVTMERSAACEAGLLNVELGEWAVDLLRTLAMPTELLPSLVRAGDMIGRVRSSTASQTGLTPGTPVVAGGPDTQCGLLGMGAVRPGSVGVVVGSTAPVQMTMERCLLDDAARTWSGVHVTPGRWVIEGNAGDAGGAYGWLAATAFSSEGEGAFATMDRLAARVPPGANGALAYLGPRLANATDMSPRWGGLLFPTPFIVGPMDRGHLARAALENLAFAIHANVNQLQTIAAAEVEIIYVGGGMARGRAFLPIVAGVLGKQVQRMRTHEVTAQGAAMCAAAGAGFYGSLEEASEGMAQRARPVDPDPLQAMEYEEHYERWRLLGEALQGVSDAL